MPKTKSSLSALNEHLFETLDRITNDDLEGDKLDQEIKRADTVVKVAKEIVDSGALALQAMKHLDEYGYTNKMEIPMLGITHEK